VISTFYTANKFADYHAVLDKSGYSVSITENFSFTTAADSSNISYTYNTNGIRLTSVGWKSMTYDNEGQIGCAYIIYQTGGLAAPILIPLTK
jgi:hypothetical protein